MNKLIIFISALLIIIVSGELVAEDRSSFETGVSLLAKLERADYITNDPRVFDGLYQAKGYILAVHDCFNDSKFRTPDNISEKQIIDIVRKYLEEHPETRKINAPLLIIKAIQQVYPKELLFRYEPSPVDLF